MSTATTNPNEFLTDLLVICEENPEKRNPTNNYGECSYLFDPDPERERPEHEADRCLIGTYLSLHGNVADDTLHDAEGCNAEEVLESLGYEHEVADLASRAQRIADKGSRKWGDVAKMIRAEGWVRA